MAESSNLFNIYDFIISWAKAQPMNKDLKSKVNWDAIGPEHINVDHLNIRHGKTEHEVNEDVNSGIPQLDSYVLFSSVFTNDTDQPQTYSLRTERRTSSICRVSVTKGLTVGMNVDLKLTPPNPILTANAGFRRDMSFQKNGESTTTEEIVWSLDSQIHVPANRRTRAELVIEEEEYDGYFRVETFLEGKICVSLRDKSNNVVTILNIPDIRQVFTTKDGFEHVGKSQVKFTSVGKCKCRYGIRQRVDLHQTNLDE